MVNIVMPTKHLTYEEAKKVGMRGRDLARVAFDKEKILAKESMHYMKALAQ